MPCQNHRERDRCEDHIQDEAVVEQAQSCFGGEALRPCPTLALDLLIYLLLAPFCVQFGRSVPLFVAGVTSLGSSKQSRLVTFAPTRELTGGSSGHVSVDFPQIGVREIE